MSRKTRTVLAIGPVEVLLAGIWLYLTWMGQSRPYGVTADFQSTLGSTMGMAMGGFLGFGLLLYFMAAMQDRQR